MGDYRQYIVYYLPAEQCQLMGPRRKGRSIFYWALPNGQFSPFLDATERAFKRFGGLTREHLYDRPRTVCSPDDTEESLEGTGQSPRSSNSQSGTGLRQPAGCVGKFSSGATGARRARAQICGSGEVITPGSGKEFYVGRFRRDGS